LITRDVDAVRPPDVTVSASVRLPFASVRVSSVCHSTVAVLVAVRTTRPSTLSVHVFDVPHGAVVAMPTDRFACTVAPAAGFWNDALNALVGDVGVGFGEGDGAGAAVPFATVIERVAVAVAPPDVTDTRS
jgi:hypothetical protein